MSELIRADLEHLVVSALRADGEAENLIVGHGAAHGRMEAAQPGWVGRSAPAMIAKLAKWQATAAALQARVLDHGQALHNTATGYGTTDDENARALDQIATTTAQFGRLQGL